MEETNGFQQLGLSDEVLAVLKKKGFESPTAIQRLAIPVLLSESCDLIGQAQTGTGKTAAFGLPIIERLEVNKGSVGAIVLVPTRELALQVADEIASLRPNPSFAVGVVYGGQSINEQIRRLRKGLDLVVGTPGRVLDLLRRGDLKIDNVSWVVLDEADEMLNMGFIEDIEAILEHTPAERRTLLFSATMPDRIAKLSRKYMRDPRTVQTERTQLTASLTDQIYFEVTEGDKFDALTRIIDIELDFYGMVFCRTRVDVDSLTSKLIERGYSAEGLHGDISQQIREKTMNRFRKKHINILVATDVAARGIDISDLTHVINYSLPQDPEAYVHRIGRTGRAGKQGTAITFITPSESRRLKFFEKATKTSIRKEVLPAASDIVEVKKERIKDELYEIVRSGSYADYLGMAEDILEKNSPEVSLAALLKMAFKSQLEVSSYPEIRGFRVDTKGTSRLFVALGRQDGMTPRKLAEFIRKKGNISNNRIDDIVVLDTYSFVTVPYKDAETLLDVFAPESRDDKPLVTKAKPR